MNYLCLPGQASHQGPPPSGGYSPQVLCGAALCSCLAVSGPRDSPGRNLPAWLTDNAIQEAREDIWVGVARLGFPGVNFRPPGLSVLVVVYGGGWTSKHIHRVQGGVPHSYRLGASFWEGPRMVSIILYRGLCGGLCVACVHGPRPVRNSGGGQTLSCNPLAPPDTVSGSV